MARSAHLHAVGEVFGRSSFGSWHVENVKRTKMDDEKLIWLSGEFLSWIIRGVF